MTQICWACGKDVDSRLFLTRSIFCAECLSNDRTDILNWFNEFPEVKNSYMQMLELARKRYKELHLELLSWERLT